MTDLLSEDEVFVRVTRLTRSQLTYFVNAALVKPQSDADGYVFRQIDIARLELLCDLCMDIGLDDTALGIVISLLDQLHAARQDLTVIARAIEILPEDLQASIALALKRPDQFS